MDRTDELGTVLREGDHVGLRYVRHLDHDPRKVWRALTESEQLQHWFPCDIVGDRVEGAALELPFWPEHVAAAGIETPTSRGRIHVWDPPRVFEWSWDADRLRWELEGEPGRTRLTLTVWIGDPRAHGRDGGSPDDASGTVSAAAGYHACLDQLGTLLSGPVSGPPPGPDTGDLEARYRAIV